MGGRGKMIEVGEYGRTNKGKMLIFSWLQDGNGKTMDNCVVKYVNGGVIKHWLDKNEKIVKHSKNIIDLIEPGDYVNGKKVSNVDKTDNANIIEWEDRDMYSTEISNDTFIKSIVTHEQFAQMEYKVEV